MLDADGQEELLNVKNTHPTACKDVGRHVKQGKTCGVKGARRAEVFHTKT